MKKLGEKFRGVGEVLERRSSLLKTAAVAGFLAVASTMRLYQQENYTLSAKADTGPSEELTFINPDTNEQLAVPELTLDGANVEVDYEKPGYQEVRGQKVVFTEINARPAELDSEDNKPTLTVVMPLGFSATMYPPKRLFGGVKWAQQRAEQDVAVTRKSCEDTAKQLAAQSGRKVRLVVPESQGLGGSSAPTIKQTILGYFGKYNNMLQAQLDALHLRYGPQFENEGVLFLGYSRAGRMAAHMAELTAKKYGKDKVLGFVSADPAGTVIRNWAVSLIQLLKDGPSRSKYDESFKDASSLEELVIGFQTFGFKGLLSLVESMGLNNPGLTRTLKKLGKMGVSGAIACVNGSAVTPPAGHKKMRGLARRRPSLQFLETPEEDYHTHAALYHKNMPEALAAMAVMAINDTYARRAKASSYINTTSPPINRRFRKAGLERARRILSLAA